MKFTVCMSGNENTGTGYSLSSVRGQHSKIIIKVSREHTRFIKPENRVNFKLIPVFFA